MCCHKSKGKGDNHDLGPTVPGFGRGCNDAFRATTNKPSFELLEAATLQLEAWRQPPSNALHTVPDSAPMAYGSQIAGTCLCGSMVAVMGTSASVAPPTAYPLPHELSHATNCKRSQAPEIETIGGDWKVHA